MQCLYGPESDDSSSRSVLRSDVLKETLLPPGISILRTASFRSAMLHSAPLLSCHVLSFPVLSCPVLLAPSAIRQMPTLCRRNDYIKRRGAEPSFYHSVPTTGTCPMPRAQTLARGPSGTWNCVNRKLRYALCWLGAQPGRPSSIGSSSVCGSSRTQPAWLHGAMQSTRVRP